MDMIRDNFMRRGQMRAAFLVVMSRNPGLVVKRGKEGGGNSLKNGLRSAYLKMAN